MDYLIKELKYSEGAARRRLQSARLLKDIPEIAQKILDGSLSLTNLQKAAGFFKSEHINQNKKKEFFLELKIKRPEKVKRFSSNDLRTNLNFQKRVANLFQKNFVSGIFYKMQFDHRKALCFGWEIYFG